MKRTLNNQTEYKEYEKMFEHIKDISFSDHIAPFSHDEQKIIAAEQSRHEDEICHLKEGIIGPFTRTMVMRLPLEVHTQEGKKNPMQCKIRSRTMQNLLNDDIIQNIRSAWSIDLLDIDFDFFIASEMVEFSEYHSGDQNLYNNTKNHILSFIKQHPMIEKAIVENYCDAMAATLGYMKAKEPLLDQREKTSKDLFMAFGMPKSFALKEHNKFATDGLVLSLSGGKWEDVLSTKQANVFKKLLVIGNDFGGFDGAFQIKGYIEGIKKDNEEIEKIVDAIQDGQKDIQLDSKIFFLDNGDNLYDTVIEKSAYNKYYLEELNLIENNKQKIAPYLKQRYIGLGCGNGKKDYAMISEHADTNAIESAIPPFERIRKIILMDSSMKSLSKAEKLIHKNIGGLRLGTTNVKFTQEWIDILLKNDEIKTLTSVTRNPHESILNMPDIREDSNIFTLFGGTFGNFGAYQKVFLQQMNQLMNKGDIFCVSLFNQPQSKEEEQKIVDKYDTPETHMFIKNFFMKIGIPKEAIEVQVIYKNNAINIDARINSKDDVPISIHPTGKEVIIPNGTVFHCISSQRMDEQDLQKTIDQSQASLNIVDKITTQNNPFTLYVLQK